MYVTDARALHHIVVKDQYAYEETSMFIEYVLHSLYLIMAEGSIRVPQKKQACLRRRTTFYAWWALCVIHDPDYNNQLTLSQVTATDANARF